MEDKVLFFIFYHINSNYKENYKVANILFKMSCSVFHRRK